MIRQKAIRSSMHPKKIIARTTSALLSVILLVSTGVNGISSVKAVSAVTAGDTFKVTLSDYANHGGDTDIGVEDSNDATRPGEKHNSNTNAASWFEYNLSVAAETTYKMLARVASPNANQDSNAGSPYLRVYLDGKEEENRVATVHHGRTGGWITWEDTKTVDVTLPKGNHTLRVEFGAKFNASELRFEKKSNGSASNNSTAVTHDIGNETYKIDAISANTGYSPLPSADNIASDFFVGGDSNDSQGNSKYPLNTIAGTKLIYAVNSQQSAKYQLKARLRAQSSGTLYVDMGKSYIAIPYTATNGQWLNFEGEGSFELLKDIKTNLTVTFLDQVDLNSISIFSSGIILPEQNVSKKFIAAQDAVSFVIQGGTSELKTVARPDEDNSAKADNIPAVVKGDSLSFEVEAPNNYAYILSARLGGGGANNISMKTPTIGVYLDGSDKKLLTLNGRSQINEVAPWTTATAPTSINLSKGRHTIKVVFEEDCYLNWIAFQKESDAVNIGENKVINGVDCSDSNKNFDFDAGFTPPSDNPGGKIFCDTVKGTWLEYKISVDSPAEYEFTAMVAGNSNLGDFIQMDVYLDDEKVGGTVQNKTGDWYNWTESTRVGLKLIGEHIIRLEFGSQHNLYQ
ncbi:MAG: carbohydrate-binding protein, partial [Oscillospiraceae bacterium]